ncbi:MULTISPECIES: hypothetical protein [Erysipelothrix]|nr:MULTISPECIES: hypothetical protein [Erysipelothrix]MDV7678441.1 hypothetical protein [Erysipelothrix rhusiopathiae]WMT70141.1 hypothetical protein K0H77_01125 [Erysipelothrix rhusiopathiae]
MEKEVNLKFERPKNDEEAYLLLLNLIDFFNNELFKETKVHLQTKEEDI